MKFLEKLTKKANIFQRTVGLSLNQFNIMLSQLDKNWTAAEKKRKSYDNRKRKIGAGHPYKNETLKDKLLIVLLYYKLYLTQEFLGIVVDLDQANVSRLLKKMLPLIEKTADSELSTYLKNVENLQCSETRINNFNDFFNKHPELRDVSTDATEQQCYRSKNYENQKQFYSGKKKRHTIKTQVSVSKTGKILDVSDSYGGSIHDKIIIDKEDTIHKFPKQTCHRFDSGYQGVKVNNSDYYLVLPTKKPKGKELSELAKEHNQVNSKRRVISEHVFSRLKKFRICSYLYRGKIKFHNQIVRNIAAILNFKLAHPIIVM